MPSRASTSFLRVKPLRSKCFRDAIVSMPSRASTSFLLSSWRKYYKFLLHVCQCPLGLVPHFYEEKPLWSSTICLYVSMPSRASTSFLQWSTQKRNPDLRNVSMPSRASTSFLPRSHYTIAAMESCTVSMPSRASTSFLPPRSWTSSNWRWWVSMPSRASTSFLRTPSET